MVQYYYRHVSREPPFALLRPPIQRGFFFNEVLYTYNMVTVDHGQKYLVLFVLSKEMGQT